MKSSKIKSKKSTPQHANQQMLKVAVVVIAIIVILSVLFLLPKKQFAGKAVEFGELGAVGAAGVGTMVKTTTEAGKTPGAPATTKTEIMNTIEAGQIFYLPIRANIGDKKSVAMHFKLTFPSSSLEVQDCNDIAPDEGLAVIAKVVCTDGSIEFDYATLCDETCSNALTGEEKITGITFLAKDYAEPVDIVVWLTFKEFTILDLETNENLVTEIQNAEINIVKGKAGVPQVEDLNADGCVNLIDVSIAAPNLDLACSTAKTVAQGDVNGDGCVNHLDAAIITKKLDWGCVK